MGLVIRVKRNTLELTKGEIVTWEIFNIHVNKLKKFKNKNINLKDIDFDEFGITASGHELTYILNKFKNIPMFSHEKENDTSERGYAMTWYGDIAKFIIGNLI